ncbi:MAG: ABC transporter ATP-binding protein [Phascolarctobacterium faecium]|uniref:ABC transporter ATP-binding protein n=1 Tax=Phascolarctobacterium faecium TaxID=33025 RepID=UPI002E78F27D|nr:ABC transporter ATP-binding protein [Phascolarctobacterium faecium]MED9990711.1 ABC transporter ATP-binding protein [Phascolarctobacterium faecium]
MLLKVTDLDISYGSKATVTGANIELKKGEILSIVGESGSGKTTVIRAIMGCLPGNGHVSGGNIIFDGRNLLDNTPQQWREMCGTEISMIFQDSGNMINPIRRIGEQFIDYILTHAPQIFRREAYDLAIKMLDDVRMPNPDNVMRSYPFELSGGMRQRVGIALAMTFSPKLLLADEPTSALDVTTQAQIIRQIVDVRDEYNAAVIIVTHNLGVASYMSNKIVVMQNGMVVESGLREEIIGDPQHEYTKELLAAVPVVGGKRYYA